MGVGHEAGIGTAREGQPRLLFGQVELGGHGLELGPAPLEPRRREPRLLRAAVGPAGLVGEGGRQRRHRRGVEPVVQAAPQGLGHQQVALMVDASQHVSALGERPPVDVAPRLQHAQHPVELVTQRLGAAVDAPLDAAEVLLQPVGPVGGAQVPAQVRAGRDGMLVDRTGDALTRPGVFFRHRLAGAEPAESLGHLPAEDRVPGRVGHGQLDPTHGAGRKAKIAGRQSEVPTVGGEGANPHVVAPAAGGGDDRHPARGLTARHHEHVAGLDPRQGGHHPAAGRLTAGTAVVIVVT